MKTYDEIEKMFITYGQTATLLQHAKQSLNEYVKLHDDITSIKSNKKDEFFEKTVKIISDCYKEEMRSINKEIEELTKINITVHKNLEKLDSLQKRIIQLRYVKQYSWVKVSLCIGYSEKHIFKVKNTIFKTLSEEWED